MKMKGVAGARVVAKAIVGYCDGMNVHPFEGLTYDVIAEEARRKRDFYWDTIFCPDRGDDRTYSEIVDAQYGLVSKMRLSQSQKAIMAFLTFRMGSDPKLFK